MIGAQMGMIKALSFALRGLALTCAMVCALVVGCTSVPLNVEKPLSWARSPSTPAYLPNLARQVLIDDNSGASAFAPLSGGHEALGSRLRLIEAAEDSLDLQYFLMKPDLSGALVSAALLTAADRGVRVRFLLDDIFTEVSDHRLSLLNAHPNIEVRIFNPVPRYGIKALGFVADYSRTNRRMHNKTFVADGAFSIIGGRNIADDYFQINTRSEFADFDMLISGPVISSISEEFDLYWNDGWSVPMERLHRAPSQEALVQARSDLINGLLPARAHYERAVNDPYLKAILAGEKRVYRGHAKVVTDRPDKLKVPVSEGERVLADDLLGRMAKAQKDVLLLTPYFVPEDYGERLFTDLARRGVRVRIVTNSLASNNHATVHAGYQNHRKSLLKAGVELYEVRVDALQALNLVSQDDDIGVVMHTKMAMIDNRDLFIGSLNFDPRSIKLNTELGMYINSIPLTTHLLADFQKRLPKYTYRLALNSDGSLVWHYDNPDAPSVAVAEPGASLWRKFVSGVTGLLGVEEQL